jgi:phosphonate transport system ATP-binding protein
LVSFANDQPVIDIRGASVYYDGAPALADIDLVVRPGERVALLGRSGAGKSTLLRIMNGSVRVSGGAVTVLGTDLATAAPRRLREVRRSVGMVSQDLDLPGPLRVRHSVAAGLLGVTSFGQALRWLLSRHAHPAAEEALRLVDLEGFADRRTDELSGGERQRVAVARVLTQGPLLVLADEPTSSLDPELSTSIAALLMGLAGRTGDDGCRTVVASLHRPELARRHCDRVIGLIRGRIALDLPSGSLSEHHLDQVYGGERP